MENRSWKLGESCFIVDLSISYGHARITIMPAIITRVSASASATAFSTAKFGPQFVEGQPFACEKEAREWIAAYVGRITAAAAEADIVGMQPGWYIPSNVPAIGDTVYTVDIEEKEILEVVIGITLMEGSRLRVGYDPGNSEASHVSMEEWWLTRKDAEAYAHKQHPGVKFSFLTKEQVRERSDAEIQGIFDQAEANLHSPGFLTNLKGFVEALRNS